MFTKPSVNQIEQAYTGNYQPLAAKVDQDKKQHGGIPHDLRQLLALNDLITNQNAGGIQQALNMPTDMPTVAQNAQQMAQQAIQARMMQQVHEQQRKDGKPMTVPPGVPQPDMQPRGIDSIPTNVGSGYAEGGIIGFDGTKGSEVKEKKSSTLENMLSSLVPDSLRNFLQEDSDKYMARLNREKAMSQAAPGLFEQLTDEERQKRLEKTKEIAAGKQQGSPTDPNFRRVQNTQDPRIITTDDSVAPTANVNPTPPKTSLFRDTGAMPAGERPAGGLDQYLATPQRNLEKIMNVDPDAVIKGGIDMYSKYVGSPSTVGIDRLQAELERRKAKIEGEAPKPGFGGLMDYLGHIAGAGGKRWQDAGYAGSVSRQNAQKSREDQINALIEKGIDLAQKKEDVAYGVKKEGFGVGLKEMQDAVKRKYDAAIALETDALEREKLKQQKELELKRIANMHINPLLQLASALQGSTPEKREAILQSAGLMYGNRQTGSDAALLKQYNDEKKNIEKSDEYKALAWLTGKEKQALEAKKASALADVEKMYAPYGIGSLGKGSGELTATAVPLPSDARTNPSKLVVGTIYQTAQGPGKWNGKGFDPQ